MLVRIIKEKIKGEDGRLPAGTLVEHWEAFRLCEGKKPTAEPVDDEAKATVAARKADRNFVPEIAPERLKIAAVVTRP